MNNTELASFQAQVKAAQSAIRYCENLPADAIVAFSSGSDLAKTDAENTLEQPGVKERICAGLQSISDDLDKITEKTTELLLGMVALGTLVIAQNPLVYAWIGIIVYRATVEGFCVEFHGSAKSDK